MDLLDFAICGSERKMKILRFPLVRFFIAIGFLTVFIAVALFLAALINKQLFSSDDALPGSAIQMVLACIFAWGGYVLYCATIEGRRVGELDPHKGFRQTLAGLFLGFGFISLIMLLMWLSGGYKIHGFNSPSAVWPFLIMAVQAGIVEEILSRGIIFRIAEEGIGTWWSVLLSALIFGFMHLGNPNASWFSSVSIALTAGVVLAMLYVITRQLWIPIGMHIGWNLTLGGIYGAPVSGGETGGLVQAGFYGPEWLTGGAFGPEASVLSIGVFSVFGVFLFWKIKKGNLSVKPIWRNPA